MPINIDLSDNALGFMAATHKMTQAKTTENKDIEPKLPLIQLHFLGRSLNDVGFRVIGLERDKGHNQNAKKRTSKVSRQV